METSKQITPDMDGKTVTVSGFVQHTRALGSLIFIKLRDTDGVMQLTLKKGDVPDKLLNHTTDITRESTIIAKGKVKKSNKSQNGYEIIPEEITVTSKAKAPLAIEFYGDVETDLSKRLDYRWLDLRNPKNALVIKVGSTAENSMREYLLDKGFIEIHSPKIMSTPSESGSELFEVKYFKRKAYLAQSPQFYKQMAIASGLGKVFEVGPVFRAEESRTSRHTTQFDSFDVEFSSIQSEEDVMSFQEELIVNMFKKIKEQHGDEIKDYYGIELKTPKTPFPRMTVRDAVEKVNPHLLETDEFSELDTQGEKDVGEYIKKKHKHDFVFLTRFPYTVRPFYHMKQDDDKNITRSYDLLYKGVEITTGAQREHRLDVLKKQAKEKGPTEKSVSKYLEFFEYGCPPHGGFGMGPSRLLMRMLDLDNIREAVLVPRDVDRLDP